MTWRATQKHGSDCVGMRVLVTGGNRYIGLHLLRELVRRGHDVTVVNSHEADIPTEVRRIHCDRRIPGVLVEALGPVRDEFDVVFDNTAYDVGDLEPMVELFAGRIRHFVFTSSSAVYRRSFVQPMLESFRTHDADDPDPRKAYGVGKVRCEQHLLGQHADRRAAGDDPARRPHARPDEPVGVARPDLLRPPGGRPADPRPRRGVLVDPPRPRRRRRRADGVDRRQRRGGRADLQRRRPRGPSIVGAVEIMARAVGVGPTSSTCRWTSPGPSARRSCTGAKGSSAAWSSRSTRRSRPRLVAAVRRSRTATGTPTSGS